MTTTAADMTHMLPDQTLTCQYLIANKLKTKLSYCILYSNMLQSVKSYIFSSSNLFDPTHLYADNFLSILSYKCFLFFVVVVFSPPHTSMWGFVFPVLFPPPSFNDPFIKKVRKL